MTTELKVEVPDPTKWETAPAYGPKRYELDRRTVSQDGKPDVLIYTVNAQFKVKCSVDSCEENVVDEWVSGELKPTALAESDTFVTAGWSREQKSTKTCTCGQENTFILVCKTVVTHYLDTDKLVWE